MLDESGLSIDGAVAAGLVAAIDARPLKEIAGKRKGGEIGGAPSYTHHPPAPRLRSTPGARVSPYTPRAIPTLSSGAGVYHGKNEEERAILRDSVHEQLNALRESELSVKGAVALGLVAAADAPALKQIEGKRKGGEIGGAASHPPPPLHPLTSTHSVTDGGSR